ncbi:unnamed protein product [Caenorhabditis bovis]|uniref:Galactokinase n=1 Tax=Caenorhabditis bovis TaxID=2654633 RepID=A0A8S1F6Y6_9PELO|nr:unnamed protein product [Caenorhabditis bovis]
MTAIKKFEDEFEHPPEICVRCPGRVNLIGEHIDYHAYGVFPMAIAASTTVWAAKNETSNMIRFSNVDDNCKPFALELPSEWNGASPPKWYDYMLCGWKGVLNHFNIQQFGMDILVDGNIPRSAGLSSSSSLVCAAALATLSLIDKSPFEKISKEAFAHLCAESELFIGTLSGGMDQAAEVLAVEGTALKIDFFPLAARHIRLPENALFVVAHSNTELNKAATSHYNERVIEGRIVAEWLKNKLNINSESFRLKDVQKISGKSFDEMLQLIEQLPDEADRHEAEELIGKENLEKCFTENTKHFTHFKPRPRARHVFSEARRVDQFEIACENGDIRKMGELMNESHESCAKDYECSCPELDETCRRYLEAGALGARLTGAGWGGCAVVLFDVKDAENAEKLEPLFVSKPASGIEVNYL